MVQLNNATEKIQDVKKISENIINTETRGFIKIIERGINFYFNEQI